ncbi:MAG: alpha/beta hydrolase [Candidatus Dojkabacteria bacterium]|nr:alpha/beta hydrolase [Candidatus Dojkabacteria bacterium]
MTIFLIHGWGGSKKSLTPLEKNLIIKGYKTINLELPGHGDSPEMNIPWNMKNFANWLESNIGETKDYILVGHSFGGKTIIKSIIENITTPNKIVLIDTNGIQPRNSFKRKVWKLIAKLKVLLKVFPFSEKIKYFVYRYIIGEVDYYKTKDKKNLRASFQIC